MKIIAQAAQEQPIITPEGAQRRLLSYGGAMMAVQFTFDADMTLPIHNHPHEQIGYVIEGDIDLHMEHEGEMHVTRLGAGGSYYVPPKVRHGIVTRAPSVLIDCFTPIREDFLVANDQ
jgi:quercetin dioxygenase-like cupin family protein